MIQVHLGDDQSVEEILFGERGLERRLSAAEGSAGRAANNRWQLLLRNAKKLGGAALIFPGFQKHRMQDASLARANRQKKAGGCCSIYRYARSEITRLTG
jgi:hypothetical protein